jgi:TolB-like protein
MAMYRTKKIDHHSSIGLTKEAIRNLTSQSIMVWTSKTKSLLSSLYKREEFPLFGKEGLGEIFAMTCFFNYGLLSSIAIFLVFILLPGYTWAEEKTKNDIHKENFSIAVFPVENLSGTMAPLKDIRGLYISQLKRHGFHILEDEGLEKFMARNRIRYTGGMNKAVAQAFKNETGVGAVMITSLELYNEANPPKIALTSRLVSAGDNPTILWIDGVGLAGDDSPGILGLGLIEDPKALLEKAVGRLTGSLEKYLNKTSKSENIKSAKRKFRPKISYRSDILVPNTKYTVAVVPFLNFSGRRNAGEILELQFIQHLKKFEQFDVIEPGIVRQQLLTLRIIIPEGISLANADALFATLDADLILAVNVDEYADYQGGFGKPKVDFFAQLIDRKSRSVVWSSVSHNEGDDGVFFFDRGKVNTAHAMASQMTQWIGERIVEKER